MNKKLFMRSLSLIMALVMVVALLPQTVNVAKAATTIKAITGPALQLAGANGEVTLNAKPGDTVEIYMTAVGDWSCGYNCIGGYVSYPEGWTVKTTDVLTKTMVLDDVDADLLFTNYDGVNPVCVVWTTNGEEIDADTCKVLTYKGTLAKLTFTIPEDAADGTYNMTLDTKKNNPNWVRAHDVNGVITDFNKMTTLDVSAINCSIVIEEDGVPGDLDGKNGVNTDDVIALLLYLTMPDMFPLPANVNADLDHNGDVNTDDAVKLLLHISMPDMFPLT